MTETSELTSGEAVDQVAELLGGNDAETAIDDAPADDGGQPTQSGAQDAGEEEALEDTGGDGEGGEGEEAEADDYLNIAELAAALGTSEESLHVGDDGVVSVAATVRGQRSNVPLDEMRRSYQVQQVQDEKAHQLNQSLEAVTQQQSAGYTRIEEQVAIANGVLQTLSEQIGSAMQSPELDQLRVSNPGEYSARLADIQRQQGQFQALQQQLGTVWQEQVKAREDGLRKTQQERLQRGIGAMDGFYKANPKAPDIRSSDGAREVMQHLQSLGFTDAEVHDAFNPNFAGTPMLDHRVLELAARSKYLETIQSGAAPAEKKVRRMRKVMRPGAQRSNAQKVQTDSLNAGKRFKKNLDAASAVDYLLQSGGL